MLKILLNLYKASLCLKCSLKKSNNILKQNAKNNTKLPIDSL